MFEENLWQTVLAQIQLNISEANFATWFKNTQILSKEEEKIVISVPNSFAKEWLENKYQRTILKVLHRQDSKIKKIDFIVGKTNLRTQETPFIVPKTDQPELKISKSSKTGLNPRYTFENFIVGSFNELAHAAAWAVSENPGLVYNPLFVYGKVGLGKTHLLQAVGNEIAKRSPEKEMRYSSAEMLVSGIVSSIRDQTIEKFKALHKKIDVLIIDDIQFLAGKEKTQEEFFHIFNTLYHNQKQIILSSDHPPKAIPALAERLRSRFEGGMIADIGYPDFETRIAILKTKAQEKKDLIPENVYNFLASTIQTNIRELEGALNRVILFQKTYNRKITLDEVKSLLKEITVSPLQKNTPKRLIQTVAEFYDLKEKDILSNSRKKEIVRPRQIAMYLLRKKMQSSYPFIARIFGGKDHTTAIYAFEKISKELQKNEGLERDLNLIYMQLLNG